jgi:integrase
MSSARKRKPARKRVGRVSYYRHHSGWYIYYLDGGRQIRRRVSDDEETAAKVAAQTNAQLSADLPTQFSFTPVSIAQLQRRFLEHHEHVKRSSLATISRYRAATQHLVDYAVNRGAPKHAHQIDVDDFVRCLRQKRVSANGHPNTRKKPLQNTTARFVLQTCRSLYGFAARKRHLPPFTENPFAGIGTKRRQLEDAKPVFVFNADTELRFLQQADDWTFAIHFTLAKTGLRSGELMHLLIEDVDLEDGWLHVRNKVDLGWHIKTRRDRMVPLVPELVAVLRRVMGSRRAGVLFLRQRFCSANSRLAQLDRKSLARAIQRRIKAAEEQEDRAISREEAAKIAADVWRDAGVLRNDRIRNPFIRIAESIGLEDVTCPKCWRHSFATLLQDANVDPLIRQITLGHAPSTFGMGALGMTSVYTHTRSATQRSEIERALRLWPETLELAQQRAQGGAK